MNALPWDIAATAICLMGLFGLAFAVLSNTQRIRGLETRSDGHITKPALESFGEELLGEITKKFDAMELAQAKREEERMAYLLRNAEALGGVKSSNQLLTGQLATLAAKLDRQIELAKLAQNSVIARAALDVPVPYTT